MNAPFMHRISFGSFARTRAFVQSRQVVERRIKRGLIKLDVRLPLKLEISL
jgi:hypothetical protein